MRINVEPIGKTGLWAFSALLVSTVAFGVLCGLRAGSLGAAGYGVFYWAVLATPTFPLILAPVPLWVVAAHFFARMERSRGLFAVGISVAAALGVAARAAVTEWPTVRGHPLWILNDYYATEWLALWCGFAAPRFLSRELRLGAVWPRHAAARRSPPPAAS